MTQFHLMSDLHLEFADLQLPGGDVLVLAGDVLVAAAFRLADNTGNSKQTKMAEVMRRFLSEETAKYRQVVYVCGNHEFYHNSYFDAFARIRKELPDNVSFLENESCVIDDVHIYGATFWTDMNKGDPISIEVIRDRMNDYGVIKHNPSILETGAGGRTYYTNKFTPNFSRLKHRESVTKLVDFVDDHQDDKVLVVSHHAPCELSIGPAFKSDYHLNGAYYSDLSSIVLNNPCIKAWVHGHIHCKSDYMLGDARIMCNPRGYPGEHTFPVFDNNFTFTI